MVHSTSFSPILFEHKITPVITVKLYFRVTITKRLPPSETDHELEDPPTDVADTFENDNYL